MSATGLTVGCRASRLPSSPCREIALTLGYSQTFVRLRPYPSQLHIVSVGTFGVFKHKHELMTRTVKRPDAAVVFDPDTEVEERLIDLIAGGE